MFENNDERNNKYAIDLNKTRKLLYYIPVAGSSRRHQYTLSAPIQESPVSIVNTLGFLKIGKDLDKPLNRKDNIHSVIVDLRSNYDCIEIDRDILFLEHIDTIFDILKETMFISNKGKLQLNNLRSIFAQFYLDNNLGQYQLDKYKVLYANYESMCMFSTCYETFTSDDNPLSTPNTFEVDFTLFICNKFGNHTVVYKISEKYVEALYRALNLLLRPEDCNEDWYFMGDGLVSWLDILNDCKTV